MNNDVKWSRFIIPKKVEQINDYLFIDTQNYTCCSWLPICRTTNLEPSTKSHQTCFLFLLVQIQTQSLPLYFNSLKTGRLVNSAPLIRRHTRFCTRYKYFFTYIHTYNTISSFFNNKVHCMKDTITSRLAGLIQNSFVVLRRSSTRRAEEDQSDRVGV